MDTESRQQVLRIEKKGDFNIQEFAYDGEYVVYSDCKDTQVFHFDRTELSLRKLTKKICVQNEIHSLPSSQRIFLKKEDEGSTKMILATTDLDIIEVDLTSFTLQLLCSKAVFKKAANQSTAHQKEFRPNDKVISLAYLNPKSNLLALSFVNSKHFHVVDLNQKDKLDWSLPVLQDLGVPLAITGDMDKLVVAYDTNKIAVFDLLNK